MRLFKSPSKNKYIQYMITGMLSMSLVECVFSADGERRPFEHSSPITLDVMEDLVVPMDGHSQDVVISFPRISLVARGYERDYVKFLEGVLIWTDPADATRKLEFKIKDLENPLSGEFDISKCGNASQYFAIMTGYRKNATSCPSHEGKVEIWITPRFLVKKAPGTLFLEGTSTTTWGVCALFVNWWSGVCMSICSA